MKIIELTAISWETSAMQGQPRRLVPDVDFEGGPVVPLKDVEKFKKKIRIFFELFDNPWVASTTINKLQKELLETAKEHS